ncbi:hypothetical protein M2282_002274 [Variovorax boronicumulans]|uniref:helix-turn-helix transcriptional regulator n=1 Tax=Variovorax boronicumulans TaxID=436515 RepID=UPI0024752326|nr:WYL domain-containing protein [Variovorax boronicumulans]MDH6167125.1 hypothetical protein [Variovorax boronicumulans]
MSVDGREARNVKVGRILLWEGRVSRSRLVAEYGLSPIRASEWLRDFRESFPDWTTWDSKLKADVATFTAYSEAERAGDSRQPGHLTAMLTPYVSNGPNPQMPLLWDFVHTSPHTFSRLNLAIADQRRVKFLYCSMGNPEPHERTIEPHSIVKTGRRWHVRGYCVEKKDFRDFVLGRMSKVKLLPDARTADVTDDVAWSTIINVRIIAHPKLSVAQQVVVRNEYFKGAAARVENCRAALLNYLAQELMAATDVKRQAPPDFQLAIENMQECRRWLFPT